MQLLIGGFIAGTFLQSGWDKLNDRKGNLAWMTPHFGNSGLKNFMPLLLTLLTLLELGAAVLTISGMIVLVVKDCDYWLFWGNVVAGTAFLTLFIGQRIAKDYAGAAAMVPYFLVALLGLYLNM